MSGHTPPPLPTSGRPKIVHQDPSTLFFNSSRTATIAASASSSSSSCATPRTPSDSEIDPENPLSATLRWHLHKEHLRRTCNISERRQMILKRGAELRRNNLVGCKLIFKNIDEEENVENVEEKRKNNRKSRVMQGLIPQNTVMFEDKLYLIQSVSNGGLVTDIPIRTSFAFSSSSELEQLPEIAAPVSPTVPVSPQSSPERPTAEDEQEVLFHPSVDRDDSIPSLLITPSSKPSSPSTQQRFLRSSKGSANLLTASRDEDFEEEIVFSDEDDSPVDFEFDLVVEEFEDFEEDEEHSDDSAKEKDKRLDDTKPRSLSTPHPKVSPPVPSSSLFVSGKTTKETPTSGGLLGVKAPEKNNNYKSIDLSSDAMPPVTRGRRLSIGASKLKASIKSRIPDPVKLQRMGKLDNLKEYMRTKTQRERSGTSEKKLMLEKDFVSSTISDDVDTDFYFDLDEEDTDRTQSNWSYRFQTILSVLRDFDFFTHTHVKAQIYSSMSNLAADFVKAACTYGKIIISEGSLPTHEKTIRPVEIGGIAGGEKYIVQNILFKFAVDVNQIMDGEYGAIKVAGNEIKALTAYFNCGLSELNLPLMALVDYMGFRIIAISMLPINRHTLVYGSNDGGDTVANKNPKLDSIMRVAAKMLNIKSHFCGPEGHTTLLHSPADLEGHCTRDGKFYLLDFSRTMPPESARVLRERQKADNEPLVSLKGSVFFRLLRPEFVKTYSRPLCSDAYTGFIRADKNWAIHEKEVDEATVYLLDHVIPKFVHNNLTWYIMEAKGRNDLHKISLSEILHTRGISMRHIGFLLRHTRESSEFLEVRSILLIEAVARVLKNILRRKLREKMRHLRQPLESPYRKLVLNYFNLVFGSTEKSIEYWNTILVNELYVQFNVRPSTIADLPNLKDFMNNWKTTFLSPRQRLFKRISVLTGCRFTSLAERKFAAESEDIYFSRPFPFDETDIDHIGERVKHMNIVAECLGSFYMFKAMQSRQHELNNALELYKVAIQYFEEALSRNPSSEVILRNLALSSQRICELESSLSRGSTTLVSHDTKVHQADQYFLQAMTASPMDPETLFCYAKFLWRCNRTERAEEHFLQSLEADPNFPRCLHAYSSFLLETGLNEEASTFSQAYHEAKVCLADSRAKRAEARSS